MTKKALEKLTYKQRKKVQGYKRVYNLILRSPYLSLQRLNTVSVSATAYLQAMVDAEVLTETEKKALFRYITL